MLLVPKMYNLLTVTVTDRHVEAQSRQQLPFRMTH